ncbi:MAG: 50S ribosomal protein L11 methyltransferase [Desulfuromonadales bacterium]
MYQPFEIGPKFRIRPPASAPSMDGRIDLIMARGAFGSGEHETTANCLEILAGMAEVKGATVLDLGSGTGILAIAALKLGAAAALCIDIDPQAVATARRNCDLNGVADRVRHHTGVLEEAAAGEFDLVLANIYGDLLLDFAPGLAARVRPGGLLLLSGILWGYNFDVRRVYANRGCALVRNYMLEEFSSVLLRKESGRG